MINSTSNQSIAPDDHVPRIMIPSSRGKIKKIDVSPLYLPSHVVRHHPKSGINGIVDAAGTLFTLISKLKHLKSYRHLGKLQAELIHEINLFYEAIQHQKYSAEYLAVCRYILCATLDDIILNTSWGKRGQWEDYALITAFSQDAQTQDKFFGIMERAIKEPAIYIDLMELMYLCLSMGYKGQYAGQHDQLEQITNHLYKHIRAWRGHFSKTLSLVPHSAKKISGTKNILVSGFYFQCLPHSDHLHCPGLHYGYYFK